MKDLTKEQKEILFLVCRERLEQDSFLMLPDFLQECYYRTIDSEVQYFSDLSKFERMNLFINYLKWTQY